MHKIFVQRLTPVAFAVALMAAAACGKSTSPATPAAPSASAPQPSAAVNGATINGTIVAGAAGASVRPMGASLTVSVVGTSISVMVDVSGNFTLQNVPSGDRTLSISGSGADAQVTITGVSDHEQIHITINVNGGTADVDEDERETSDNKAEVEGQITMITLATRTLIVGRHMTTVSVPAGTPIHHGNTTIDFAALQVGERIHVHGTKNGTMVVATDVEVQNEHTNVPPGPGNDHGNNGDNNEAEVSGTVSGIPATRACPALSFMVGTTAITTDASTKFEDTTCATLTNGDKVQVEGTKQTNGSVLAKSVEKQGKS